MFINPINKYFIDLKLSNSIIIKLNIILIKLKIYNDIIFIRLNDLINSKYYFKD